MPELTQIACDPARVAIIFNPTSGSQSPEARLSRLRELASAAGLQCEPAATLKEGGAAPAAREALRSGAERVLVCGGDGTLTQAASVLAGTSTVLGVLPGGTANLLAVNLGLPTDIEEAVRVALQEKPRPIDVGRANGRVFLVMAGIGADAQMVRDAKREVKRRLGPLAYALAAWRLLTERHTRYTITLDGRTFRRRAKTVVVANLGHVAPGLELVPGTDPRDGLLEVAIVRAWTLGQIARVVLRVLLRRNRSDELLEIHHAREVLIRCARPQPVHTDGEVAGSTAELEVHVEPRALSIARPALESSSGAAGPGALMAEEKGLAAAVAPLVRLARLPHPPTPAAPAV